MATGSVSPKRGKIIDVPANAPTIGTATDLASGGNVSVAYTPGSTVVGGFVSNYTVTSTPGSLSATGTSSPIIVTGLTNDTSYTFTVRANNPSGSSPLSSASNSVAPTAPPPVFESIATVTGTGSSLEFTSIPSTYKHLQIRGIARTNNASIQDYLTMRFNSSSTGYAWHRLYGTATSPAAQGSASQSNITLYRAAGNNATTDVFGAFIIDIHDYNSTTKNKTARYMGGIDNNDANGEINIGSGLWANTNAISSISINVGNGSAFIAGTTFALYGIKG